MSRNDSGPARHEPVRVIDPAAAASLAADDSPTRRCPRPYPEPSRDHHIDEGVSHQVSFCNLQIRGPDGRLVGESGANHPRRTPASPPDAPPESPMQSWVSIAQGAYYLVTLTVAGVGGGTALAMHLGWTLPGGLTAMAVFELGGVVLATFREQRRRVGEHAVVAGVMSLVVAATAVMINFFGHAIDPATGQLKSGGALLPAIVFAATSANAYAVYILISAARARDARRRAGLTVRITPLYGVMQWVMHPRVTACARARSRDDARLTADSSLAAERASRRDVERTRQIAAELERLIAARVGWRLARIATLTYDLPRVAAGVRDAADYEALTHLIARQLTAECIDPTRDAPRGDAARSDALVSRGDAPLASLAGASGEADASPGESRGESPRAMTDAEIEEVITVYVQRSRAEGRPVVQRELVRLVERAGGRVGQRRVTRIADRIAEMITDE